MKIVGVIPARYASTRFPGKPLVQISGKSLIERVWLQAKKSRELSDVIIATDDIRIKNTAEKFGASVVMTSKSCKSGTDRLAQAVKKAASRADIVINIQGDEPIISPGLIDKIAVCLKNDNKLSAATAVFLSRDKNELFNPNVVKVVLDGDHNALYFSRYPIPYSRNPVKKNVFNKHIGIYGYRVKFLVKFSAWRQTPLERTEQLEQLRILEMGHRLKVVVSDTDSFGVDVPADVRKIEKYIK